MIDVIKPTLLLNKQKCLDNLERINTITKKNNIKFRPHFKTHQSLQVGRWFKKFGIKSRIIPVSDDLIQTIVKTPDGDLGFQEYFVRNRCKPIVTGFSFLGAKKGNGTTFAFKFA